MDSLRCSGRLKRPREALDDDQEGQTDDQEWRDDGRLRRMIVFQRLIIRRKGTRKIKR